MSETEKNFIRNETIIEMMEMVVAMMDKAHGADKERPVFVMYDIHKAMSDKLRF